MGRPFPAKYAGRCAADCGRRIDAGDSAVMDDGEIMHEECAELDAASSRRMAQPVCPSCWLQHAGECP